MRAPYEMVNIFVNRPIVLGAINSITEGFPMGEAWRRLILRVCVVYNWTNGATPAADGIDLFLHGLTLRTSRGWTPFNNVPGRALRVIDQVKCCGEPTTFAVFAGADITLVQQYNLWFSDPLAKRPEDTLLDTSLFNKVQMDLNFGNAVDFCYGAIGTDVITTAVMDLYCERVKGKLPVKVKPVDYVEYGCPAPVAVANLEMPLERANNIAYKRLYVHTAQAGILGSSFTGPPLDGAVTTMGVDSDKGELIHQIPWVVHNTKMKMDYSIPTAAGTNGMVGWTVMDFVKDYSNMSALIAGYFSRLRLLWTVGAGATPQVSCAYEALKKIM